MAWNCSLANGGTKTSGVGGVARAGHAAGGPRSAPQMSAMSTIPIQPVPSVTGTCRNPRFTMIVAASRMLVAAGWLPGGRQVMDPCLVHVHAVGHRPGDIGLGDHADGPVATLCTEHHQSSRPGMLHQVGGRSDVVIFPHRRR